MKILTAAVLAAMSSTAMAQNRPPQWGLVTESRAGNGTLIFSGGSDHTSLQECRAEFDRNKADGMSRDNWPGTVKLAYCFNPRTGEKLTMWPENPG